MKHTKVFFLVLFLSLGSIFSFGQTDKMMGKSLEELNKTIGVVGLIKKINEQDTMSVYETNLGNQAYIIHNNKIVFINSSSYWKTKREANIQFIFSLDQYKKDGYVIKKKSNNKATAVNSKYLVEFALTYENNLYQVIENIKENIKKELQF